MPTFFTAERKGVRSALFLTLNRLKGYFVAVEVL